MNETEKQKECRRCGACCAKGGPTLHTADITLLLNGVLRPEHLVTLRAGELAVRPDDGTLMELPGEMIKIRGTGSSWTCIFYLSEARECSVHENRPQECRAFKCWDPEESESLFLTALLTRKDLPLEGSALAELMESYDKVCAPAVLHGLMLQVREGRKDVYKEDMEKLLDTDSKFRSMVRERFGLQPQEMNFYFGRSLKDLSARFHCLLEKAE